LSISRRIGSCSPSRRRPACRIARRSAAIRASSKVNAAAEPATSTIQVSDSKRRVKPCRSYIAG
jgi:hypothetical protein